jgi:hypothetical protein
VDERDARAEVANRARELVERYGLGEEYRLVQETHGLQPLQYFFRDLHGLAWVYIFHVKHRSNTEHGGQYWASALLLQWGCEQQGVSNVSNYR